MYYISLCTSYSYYSAARSLGAEKCFPSVKVVWKGLDYLEYNI